MRNKLLVLQTRRCYRCIYWSVLYCPRCEYNHYFRRISLIELTSNTHIIIYEYDRVRLRRVPIYSYNKDFINYIVE